MLINNTVIFALLNDTILLSKKSLKERPSTSIRSGTDFFPIGDYFAIRQYYHMRLLLTERSIALVEFSLEFAARKTILNPFSTST